MSGSRLGIMGGTFDPIHYGHLRAAEWAREKFGLAEVVFVPCGTPPHRPEGAVAPAEDRFRMTVLATEGNPHFSVSRREVERPGPSYSVDTVREFRQEQGEETDLYFITGVDSVLELLTWREPDNLLALCQFIAVMRPGFHPRQLKAKLGPERVKRIHLLPMGGVLVSSTEIRDRVRHGFSVRYLTPEPVRAYIEEQELYLNQPEGPAG